MRILFFGDSITQGFWSVEGGWVELIRKHHAELAVRDLTNNQQPEIFNLGVSGDTTRDLLGRVIPETEVRRWPGDSVAVVIAIGANDDLFESSEQKVQPEEFLTNLNKIIGLLKPCTDSIMFVGNSAVDETRTTPVFWGDFHYTNREIERSESMIAEVADENNLLFIPIYAEFKARLDAGEDLLADGLHPNDAGHKLIADLVQPDIDKLIANEVKTGTVGE